LLLSTRDQLSLPKCSYGDTNPTTTRTSELVNRRSQEHCISRGCTQRCLGGWSQFVHCRKPGMALIDRTIHRASHKATGPNFFRVSAKVVCEVCHMEWQ
jgi:hypothetical protein